MRYEAACPSTMQWIPMFLCNMMLVWYYQKNDTMQHEHYTLVHRIFCRIDCAHLIIESINAKNSRFVWILLWVFLIDLLQICPPLDATLKDFWINVAFFLVFVNGFVQFSTFFLSDHASTTSKESNEMNITWNA